MKHNFSTDKNNQVVEIDLFQRGLGGQQQQIQSYLFYRIFHPYSQGQATELSVLMKNQIAVRQFCSPKNRGEYVF